MIPTDLSKVLKRKADISATGDATNFPAGTKNTYRVISTAGSLGGAVGTGLAVVAGDILICHTSCAAGTYAAVGANWTKISTLATGMLNTTHIIASGSVTRDLCFGGKIGNYNQTNDVVIGPLPTAENGMNFMLTFGTAVAKYYRVDPANADLIYYEGASTGAGKYVGVAATVIGMRMQFYTIQTGASTWAWVVEPNFSGLVQEAEYVNATGTKI